MAAIIAPKAAAAVAISMAPTYAGAVVPISIALEATKICKSNIRMPKLNRSARPVAWRLHPNDLGHQQARETAATLTPKGALPIHPSLFARAREASAALAGFRDMEVTIEPRVAEIPFPKANWPSGVRGCAKP